MAEERLSQNKAERGVFRPLKNFRKVATLLGIILFLIEAISIFHWASLLQKATMRNEATGRELSREASTTSALVQESMKSTNELHFLQALGEFFPKDKGYLRTQKAVADEVEALRRKLSRKLRGMLYIVVDAKTNKLYLKKGFKLLLEADCSVGRGGFLHDKKTGQRWQFVTPRGEFRVLAKAPDPLWRKPDWAYVEAGKKIPPPNDPSRIVHGELGAYVLNLGNGYLIHGTKNEKILGRPASHGCVRLGAEALKRVYETTPIGTRVFIFY